MNYSQKQELEKLQETVLITALIDQANERGALTERIVANDFRLVAQSDRPQEQK